MAQAEGRYISSRIAVSQNHVYIVLKTVTEI
jgi:hypothetical protein